MKTLTKDKYLTESEIQELSRILQLIRPKNERDCLIIELALNSGAREAELLQVTKSDLDPDTQSIFIRHAGKGSDKREVPLSKEVFERAWNFARGLDMNDRLFPITTSRVRQIWSDIRPFKKKFHALRHTFARSLYARTKDIRVTQYSLGHKSIMNTMIYTSIDYSGNELRKAMGL